MTITADFSGGEKTVTTEPLYQWDTGQKLALSGLPQTASDIQVHFANAAMAQAIVKATATENSLPTCDIPNEFLQFGSAAKARAWVFYRASNTEGYTVRTVLIPVTPRKRPNDYVSPEDPDSQGIVERAIELLEGYEDDLASKLDTSAGSVGTENLADESITVEKVADDLAAVINAKEVKSNKKTTLTGNESSNDFYPTTKAVADALNTKADLSETSAALANKVDKSALSLYDNGYSEIPYTLESGDLASDGSEVEQPKAMRMTEMIEIRAYDRYVFDDNTAIAPRVCYYNSDGEFVTRTSNSVIVTTNSRYKYIRLAFYKNKGNISENECKSRFSIQNKTEINKRIEAITLPVTNYIDVDINGGGDYTSLYAAVTSITDSSDVNRYVIRLHEGTYDLISEIFGSSDPSDLFNTVGMILPDHVDIVGIGNRDNIIVKAQFDPATVTENLNKYFSAINLKYNNKLENITVIIQNGRYAVHDESNGEFKNYEREVKNCKFIHLGGTNTSYWQSHHAYGHGLSSGCRCYYENCVFETQSTESAACAYGCHNATGEERFASIVFKSCVFSNSSNNTKGVSIGSMVSGTEDYIIFEGCDFCNTNILVKEQLTTVESGITIKPKGYANRNIRDKIINDSTGDYTVVEVY